MAADLAFMLRDHEGAVSHYRLLQGDYKADKVGSHTHCTHIHPLCVPGHSSHAHTLSAGLRGCGVTLPAAAR